MRLPLGRRVFVATALSKFHCLIRFRKTARLTSGLFLFLFFAERDIAPPFSVMIVRLSRFVGIVEVSSAINCRKYPGLRFASHVPCSSLLLAFECFSIATLILTTMIDGGEFRQRYFIEIL